MSEVDDKLEAFINAEGDAVLDAFLALLPTEEENYNVANSPTPAKFISKLHDIESSARVILSAASDYAGAKLMRMRCEKRRIPRKRIQRVDFQTTRGDARGRSADRSPKRRWPHGGSGSLAKR